MFKKNIAYLRKKLGFNQDELANKIGVSRQTISKWENGEVTPDSHNLIMIAELFKIKVHDLVMSDLTNLDVDYASKEMKLTEKETLDSETQPELFNSKESHFKPNRKSIIISIFCVVSIFLIILVYLNREIIFVNNESSEIDGEIVEEVKEETAEEVVIVDYSKFLSAGREFSVYIDESGSVLGFGDNTYKQLNFSNWKDISQIAAGGFHTLGLKSDGTVLSTGYNNFGQIDVSNWKDIIQVSAGRYHSIGLKSDGKVVCVGESKYGACDVSAWSEIKQISAGRYNSYGVRSDGTVISTSSNEYGQANINDWSDIIQISAGTYHVLGLKSDGSVLCAGGQSGDGVCKVSSWSDIKQVVGAGYHSIGLKNDGTVVAVGNNGYGQIDTSSWSDIVAIAGGRYHTVGLTSANQLIAVGSNAEGQIAFSSNGSSNTTNNKPKDPIENKDKENYIISFNTNDGSEIDEIKLERGSEFKSPKDPMRDGYIFAGWYSDKELTKYFEFPKKIDSDLVLYADWGSEGLEYTILSDGTYSVKAIKDENLSVTIPNRYKGKLVTEIANFGFSNSKITSIILPKSIKKIGESAFKNTKLSSINIPSSVENIGDFAFEGNSMNVIIIEDGSKISELKGLNNIYKLKEIILPEGIISIGEAAFMGTSLGKIVIPNSVIEIKSFAFSSMCWNPSVQKPSTCGDYYGYLEKIEFKANSELKKIGSYAFAESQLKTIKLPAKLEIIGQGAFQSSYNLKEVYIPKSVTKVETFAFAQICNTEISIQKGTVMDNWSAEWINNSGYCLWPVLKEVE